MYRPSMAGNLTTGAVMPQATRPLLLLLWTPISMLLPTSMTELARHRGCGARDMVVTDAPTVPKNRTAERQVSEYNKGGIPFGSGYDRL